MKRCEKTFRSASTIQHNRFIPLNILINLIYSENSITEFLSNMRDMMSKRVITLRVDAVQYFYIAIENNKVLSHIRDIFAIL